MEDVALLLKKICWQVSIMSAISFLCTIFTPEIMSTGAGMVGFNIKLFFLYIFFTAGFLSAAIAKGAGSYLRCKSMANGVSAK